VRKRRHETDAYEVLDQHGIGDSDSGVDVQLSNGRHELPRWDATSNLIADVEMAWEPA
jgi:hypothetical protein